VHPSLRVRVCAWPEARESARTQDRLRASVHESESLRVLASESVRNREREHPCDRERESLGESRRGMCSTVRRLPPAHAQRHASLLASTSHARSLAVSSSRDLALCLPRTLGTSRALFLVASVTHSRTSVFRRSTSRAGQPRRHPRRGLVCARGGQTCGSGDAWCGVARSASVWSWRRCRFSTGLQRARSTPGRGVGGLCAARHRQTLALSAAVTDSRGWSGAWRAGEGAGKLLRAAVRRFLGAIGGSRAFVGAALGGFGAFIGAPGAVVRTRDCRVGAFLVGALGCGLGRRFGVARSVASRARRSASAACSAATADAARAWERASRACCSAVSALRRVSCADEIVERASARARPLRTHVQRRGGCRALCSREVRVVEVPDRGPARSCSSSGCQGGRTRRLHGAQVTQRGGAWSRHWRPVGTG